MSQDVEFSCPHCGQVYRLNAQQAGKRAGQTINCRKCQGAFVVPQAEEPLASAASVAEHNATSASSGAPPMPPAIPMVAPQVPADVPVPASSRRLNYRPASQSSDWQDFCNFRWMIAPWVIKVLFWVGTVICVMGGVAMLIEAMGQSRTDSRDAMAALGVLVAGPFLVRLYCEFLIVVFRIHEALVENNRLLRERE